MRTDNIFIQGKPCPKCGSRERYHSTGKCVPCVRELQRGKMETKRRAAGIAPRAFKAKRVTGTLAAVESFDKVNAMATTPPNTTAVLAAIERGDIMVTPATREALANEFLRRLAARDMAVWAAHQRMTLQRGGHADADEQDDTPATQGRRPDPVRVAAKAAAKARGENKYETAQPCPQCQTRLRYIATDTCVKCNALKKIKRKAKAQLAAKEAAARGTPRPPLIAHGVPLVATGALGTGHTPSRVALRKRVA